MANVPISNSPVGTVVACFFPLTLSRFFVSRLQTDPAPALRFWFSNLNARVQECPSV